ncbi:SDR family NAD(P)-dependent oxidoreductase [Sphingomonas sp. ID0503]|jgi:2,5-dichloro-2,5-cyclohexadiene-1,4-diol dehydrogenase 1|uniref:SDR family NAD(P)-dependent oxidoreductase n=1 Tax=Sphingomonas sp. ID0503 TaxID=3399691 RepID=UPI003AFB4905
MRGLSGKSVLVTGGGSGIGRAVALLLAESGSRVTVADRTAEAAEAVAREIRDAGQVAEAVTADVSSEDDVRAMVEAAGRLGPLTGAVNAAGVPQVGKLLHEVDLAEWDRCHGVNLRGLFLCNKYEVAAMLAAGGGSIVNIASTAAMVGFPNGAEYCASKAGVMGLVRGGAIDYATKGIRINAVLPGGTLTPMLKGAMALDRGLEPALAAVHPMNRFGQPEEIAAAARFLISDEASFVTGASYAVDGGHTCI